MYRLSPVGQDWRLFSLMYAQTFFTAANEKGARAFNSEIYGVQQVHEKVLGGVAEVLGPFGEAQDEGGRVGRAFRSAFPLTLWPT